jgi:hypothetical protein
MVPTLRSALPFTAGVLLLAFTPAHSAPAPSPAHTAALRQQLAAQDNRVKLLRDELKAQDTRIEDRVDSIIQGLTAIGDSKDTRSKVARMKRDTIDRLRRNLDYFRQQRAALQEELRRPTWNLTVEEKQSAISRFDERIEKRVTQILALEKSLPTEKDYDRYKATGTTWAGTTYEVNEDYRQNQRLTAQTNGQRKETLDALDQSLQRLESQNRALQGQLALSTTSPEQGKVLSAEIAKNDALIKARRAQRVEALRPTDTATRAIGSKEAQTLDAALRKAVDELRREFTSLFALYHNIIAERSAANNTRAALAAAQPK